MASDSAVVDGRTAPWHIGAVHISGEALAAWLHIGTRLLTLAAFVVAASRTHVPTATIVTKWDGTYYATIAAHGYSQQPPASAAGRTDAFFPLFPLLSHPLTGLGLPFWVAAALLNVLCSTAAAVLIYKLAEAAFVDRNVALLLVALWSVYPLAGALSAAYSESVLTALAAACLLALQRERWWVAGICALLAGATRPTGVALSLCCLVAAINVVRRRREFRSVVAPVLAPLGFLVSVAYIGHEAHRWNAWSIAEKSGWHARFDGGADTVRSVFDGLTGHSHKAFAVEEAAFLVVAFVVAVSALVWRQPSQWKLYLLVGVVLAIGTSAVHASVARFLLPFFPLLVPIADLLARTWLWARITLLIAAFVLSISLAYFYWGPGHFAP